MMAWGRLRSEERSAVADTPDLAKRRDVTDGEGDRNLLALKTYDWGEDGPISVMRNIARERSADQRWDWTSE